MTSETSREQSYSSLSYTTPSHFKIRIKVQERTHPVPEHTGRLEVSCRRSEFDRVGFSADSTDDDDILLSQGRM
jgi:hypothetical protein